MWLPQYCYVQLLLFSSISIQLGYCVLVLVHEMQESLAISNEVALDSLLRSSCENPSDLCMLLNIVL